MNFEGKIFLYLPFLNKWLFPIVFIFFFHRNLWLCVTCDLKFSKRETILIHNKLHEDELDVDRINLVSMACPECDIVSLVCQFVSLLSLK